MNSVGIGMPGESDAAQQCHAAPPDFRQKSLCYSDGKPAMFQQVSPAQAAFRLRSFAIPEVNYLFKVPAAPSGYQLIICTLPRTSSARGGKVTVSYLPRGFNVPRVLVLPKCRGKIAGKSPCCSLALVSATPLKPL